MSSFYKCVPKITIIWCMLHEIWSATDKYFCHFGPFFSLTTWRIKILKKWNKHIHVYHKWRWFLRCKMQPTVFWTIFCSFTSLTTWKIKILKKWKNHLSRCHYFTNMYQKSQSYDVCFIRYGVQQTNIFVILGIFLT